MKRNFSEAPRWLAIAALIVAAPTLAQDFRFQLEIVPPLDTPRGLLLAVQGDDINDAGQVTGVASNADPRVNATAAFRFTPAGAMEDLNPPGCNYRSRGVSISTTGLVFGLCRESGRQTGVFLHSERSGFDPMQEGLTRTIKRSFFNGNSDQGHLPSSGLVFGSAETVSRVRPVVYTREDGWMDLSGLHPTFKKESTFGVWVNEAGYLLFSVVSQPTPEEGSGFLKQKPFLLAPDGEMFEVESPGRPVAVPGRPNSAGRLAGLWQDDRGKDRAFVFTPGGGFRDIHPGGFKESFAGWVTDDGRAVGLLKKKNRYDTVFTHTDDGGVEVVLARRQLRRLVRSHGLKFHSVRISDISDRGEIVGKVNANRGSKGVAFYYSPAHGLHSIDRIVEELATEFFFLDTDSPLISDRGHILLSGARTGLFDLDGDPVEPRAAAVLTILD